MLSTFLFFVFLSIYMWLYYEPNDTSNQHHRYGSADIAATTTKVSNAEASLPAAKLQPNQDKATVQIVDKRIATPERSLLNITEEKPTVKTESIAIQDTSLESKLVEVVENSSSKKHPQAEEDMLVQTSELELVDADMDLEPALTEEEALLLAVETTMAKETMMEASTGDLEDGVPELMRPKPPNPELVEAAVRDAEEKLEDFSPPEIAADVSQLQLKRKK